MTKQGELINAGVESAESGRNEVSLAVRLGCMGCSGCVVSSIDAAPNELLSQLDGTIPYEVKGNGAMWSRSGNSECLKSDVCPLEGRIFDLAEQLAQDIEIGALTS